MNDYSLTVKIRNGRIRKLMLDCGFKNVSDFCRQGGMSQSIVGEIINLKKAPLDTRGNWHSTVIQMAEVLGVLPEEMFSEEQKTMKLKSNGGETFITEKAFLKLARDSQKPLLSYDDSTLDECDQESKRDILLTALKNSRLNDDEKSVITRRFGLADGVDWTREELARDLDVRISTIAQTEAAGLRKLRAQSPSTIRSLKQALYPEHAETRIAELERRMAAEAKARAALAKQEKAIASNRGRLNELYLTLPAPREVPGKPEIRSISWVCEDCNGKGSIDVHRACQLSAETIAIYDDHKKSCPQCPTKSLLQTDKGWILREGAI